jgi:alpha-beta hydrolase superfamily lysophospholipase
MDRRAFIIGVPSALAWPLVARTQELVAPPRDPPTGELYVGWYELHPDVSLNFQLNRWAAMGGGPEWIADVRPQLALLRDYDSWRNTFVRLGETAAAQGRTLHAALHFRCAEFFMVPSDSRKEPLRKRLIAMFREAAGVPESARREVACGDWQLPAWHFSSDSPAGTMVVFGGFDSYIEELFPILASLRNRGWNVIGFEGPGQGSVLEEQRVPLTRDWHRPVAAVLDAFKLDDVTLVGISLGGCLAIRAAAFEPRVRRVVAFDVLSDFFECMTMSVRPPQAVHVLRGLMSIRADTLIDSAMRGAARRSPLVDWGISQAMHVFGCERPSQALRIAQSYHTADVSARVRQDVLLFGGAKDHYVPLTQLWDQARSLTAARSISVRVFTAEEQAHAHCQVGNLPLAIGTICDWANKIAAR